MKEITRTPLCWPDNVARTAPHQRTRPRFSDISIAHATSLLLAEINRLNNRYWDWRDENAVISSNLRLKLDGLPSSTQGEPADTGVAVYFQLRFRRGEKHYERPIVMTCDKWNRVSWNIYAITKDIEAQRSRARWGCGSIEQAFQGYVAIPEKCGGDAWWVTLGVPSGANRASLEAAFKAKAKVAHPDVGGSHEEWLKIQTAYEQAINSLL